MIAPALAPSFAGPRTTAAVGALAVAAQVFIAVLHGGLTTSNHLARIAALTLLSVLIVLFTMVRERRRLLVRPQSVAEAAQRALLRPLPERIGALQIACRYLAAEEETQIGGDLYTATRADHTTRLLIGDIRGKGLAAVGEAALLLSALRLTAAGHPSLPGLATTLDDHVHRYLTDFSATDDETGEHFITALLLDLPDDEPLARLTNCGHPPPLPLRPSQEPLPVAADAAPPLGVRLTSANSHTETTVPFDTGDTLLLYTDGVIDARDTSGAFYPLAERVARWAHCPPTALVKHLRRDLLTYTGGHLGDDAALIAVHRAAHLHKTPHMI
ncbi:hypothetical protein GCM10010300_34190 [Streptomyces olivaceoviridis]|uniref:PP2C family protein-serine/threonine phosphatase n=1 Tax=Streptomyces olivaceoviridis TaxID=1921 RepID=UPI0019A26E2A|nr:PP2C family protein-serine/threonine phosphatase [Streptomyces olivaceoviridis]GGY87019.1 hypothetical protein GCM10010300_34190 [Streptomyces olivaceoviridis]